MKWIPLMLAPLLVLAGCGSSDATTESARVDAYVEIGDLPQIRKTGLLRVLLPVVDSNSSLPRRGEVLNYETELIRAYAHQNDLEPMWIYVESRDQLLQFLLEGRGDVVAANLTATTRRRETVVFTVPLRFVTEQLVTRAVDDTIEREDDLDGRRISVRRSSSFWSTLQNLKHDQPGIVIEEAPENVDTEELIHRVARRRLDVTVADSNLVESVLQYRGDIRPALNLTEKRPIAWAVRPESHELLRSLNRFLTDSQLAEQRNEVRIGDLAEIRRSKVLRVLTRNSASTYFLWRGELVGFEYELAREFASRHGLRVEVVVPPRSGDLLPWLVEGRGDVVAAALTPTEKQTLMGVAFSRPYNFAAPMVVAPKNAGAVGGIEDLDGQTLFVRRSSAHWEMLQRLREEGVNLNLQAVPEDLETEEIIGFVASRRYDLTVAYSHILDIEMTWRSDIRNALALDDPVPLAWAVRESNPELRAAIDEFLEREYRGLFYNVIYKRYFVDPKKIRGHVEHRRSASGALSPYDDIVKRYAKQYDFDWRLIVALMHQESRFDPAAESFAGAVGLLQVLPRTARQMGVRDLRDPEENIKAGVKYLAWVRDRFPGDLAASERLRFTLASYNAGHEHVRDARRLAATRGLDSNLWFDNVEQAILLLSRSEYARHARYGYCRGSEPVNYVREILARYNAYREATDASVRTSLQ